MATKDYYTLLGIRHDADEKEIKMTNNKYISHADDKTFEKAVLSSDLPVLVDFWAPWCGPCHVIGPTVEELASEYNGRVKFVKVNVDDAQQTASSLDIMGIPTIILFNHGKPINRQIGAQAKYILSEMINEALRETD